MAKGWGEQIRAGERIQRQREQNRRNKVLQRRIDAIRHPVKAARKRIARKLVSW